MVFILENRIDIDDLLHFVAFHLGGSLVARVCIYGCPALAIIVAFMVDLLNTGLDQ